MGRRQFLVGAIVLVVALLAAAPFVADMRSSSSGSPADAVEPADEPPPRADPAKPLQAQPRTRSEEEDPYAEFRRYVEDRRAAGKPTTLRELLGPDPPDAENAAVEISAALDALYTEFGEESAWPKVDLWSDVPVAEQTPEQVQELREFVGRFRPFLGRLGSALDRPRCRFPTPSGPGGSVPGIRVIRKTCNLLMLIARATRDVDPLLRIEALRILLSLGRKDEAVTSFGVALDYATAMGGVRALHPALEKNEVDPLRARRVLDELLRASWLPLGPRFSELDLIGSMELMQAWIDGSLPPDLAKLGWNGPPPAAEIVAGLLLMEEASRLPAVPFPEYARMVKDIEQRSEREGKACENLLAGHPKVAAALGRTDAAMRLARIALAAAEFRATHGDFPASLDELKPMFPDGVPLDPFTDVPFVYEKTGTGVRIASAGRLADEATIDEATLRDRCLVWELKR